MGPLNNRLRSLHPTPLALQASLPDGSHLLMQALPLPMQPMRFMHLVQEKPDLRSTQTSLQLNGAPSPTHCPCALTQHQIPCKGSPFHAAGMLLSITQTHL